MSQYKPEKLVAISRYQNYFPTLSSSVQKDIYERMGELIKEEKQYCDKGINAKDKVQKWLSGTIGMAVFAAAIAGVMTLIIR